MGICLPTLNILSLINTPALGRIWLGKSDEKTSSLGSVIGQLSVENNFNQNYYSFVVLGWIDSFQKIHP
jgi:hypothetical protein